MGTINYKENKIKSFERDLSHYQKSYPEADILTLKEQDGHIFNGQKFIIHAFTHADGLAEFSEYSIREYLKRYYDPFDKASATAEDMQEILAISGITDEEATILLRQSPRCQKDRFRRKFAKRQPIQISLKPFEIEDIFGITKAERRRWTVDKRLHVVAYTEVHLAGYDSLNYGYVQAPCYSWYQALRLTPERIAHWRQMDKKKKKK